MKKRVLLIVLLVLILLVGGLWYLLHAEKAQLAWDKVTGPNPTLAQPNPTLLPTISLARAVGWSGNATPVAAPGLAVNAFAKDLLHPRNLLALPNGDILVAESGAPPQPDDKRGFTGFVENLVMGFVGSKDKAGNRIVLLRDTNGDGVADVQSVLIDKLHSPFGMALVGDQLYVANTDALVRYPFTLGQTKITVPGTKMIDLPAGPINHHWTKNVLASADGSKLYVSIGSNSNVGENGLAAEKDRAMIWEVDAKTGDHRVYAYGIRNPTAMAWEPTTKQLFVIANERDEIGSDLVPDYLTSVQFGGFYGWPWFYWGANPDVRAPATDDDLSSYSIPPDYSLGPHVAALGLTFANEAKLGPGFANGAFVGEHGSWDRRPRSGYVVAFVPFDGGKPKGKPVNVLTGFLNAKDQAQGRPVGVAIDSKGALLVADDVGNRIWRVTQR